MHCFQNHSKEEIRMSFETVRMFYLRFLNYCAKKFEQSRSKIGLIWLIKMRFVCRGPDCKKDFSTKFNRNKHEKVKKHYQQDSKISYEVPYDAKNEVFYCPSIGCNTTSRYKHNIQKHLKTCYIVNQNKKDNADNKICHICNKQFTKKSNRDRHVKNVHDDARFHSKG